MAWFIIHGDKTIENRSLLTRIRGRIVIHAGKRIDPAGYAKAREMGIEVPPEDVIPRGCLVGEVDIVDCTKEPDGGPVWPWKDAGAYHWHLANAEAYATPIPYKGRQGWFYVDEEGKPTP